MVTTYLAPDTDETVVFLALRGHAASSVRAVVERTMGDELLVRETLDDLVQSGHVVRIAPDWYATAREAAFLPAARQDADAAPPAGLEPATSDLTGPRSAN